MSKRKAEEITPATIEIMPMKEVRAMCKKMKRGELKRLIKRSEKTQEICQDILERKEAKRQKRAERHGAAVETAKEVSKVRKAKEYPGGKKTFDEWIAWVLPRTKKDFLVEFAKKHKVRKSGVNAAAVSEADSKNEILYHIDRLGLAGKLETARGRPAKKASKQEKESSKKGTTEKKRNRATKKSKSEF